MRMPTRKILDAPQTNAKTLATPTSALAASCQVGIGSDVAARRITIANG
jgi:hypothetical protein